MWKGSFFRVCLGFNVLWRTFLRQKVNQNKFWEILVLLSCVCETRNVQNGYCLDLLARVRCERCGFRILVHLDFCMVAELVTFWWLLESELAGRAVVARVVDGWGLGQQVGQALGNVNPMSPTRAEAGCAGVPLPPSTPSSASRQQQANVVGVGFNQNLSIVRVEVKKLLTSWKIVQLES